MLQGWISDSEKTVPAPTQQPQTPATTTPANRSAGKSYRLRKKNNFFL